MHRQGIKDQIKLLKNFYKIASRASSQHNLTRMGAKYYSRIKSIISFRWLGEKCLLFSTFFDYVTITCPINSF